MHDLVWCVSKKCDDFQNVVCLIHFTLRWLVVKYILPYETNAVNASFLWQLTSCVLCDILPLCKKRALAPFCLAVNYFAKCYTLDKNVTSFCIVIFCQCVGTVPWVFSCKDFNTFVNSFSVNSYLFCIFVLCIS